MDEHVLHLCWHAIEGMAFCTGGGEDEDCENCNSNVVANMKK